MKILSNHLIHLASYGNDVLDKKFSTTISKNKFVDAQRYIALFSEIFKVTNSCLTGIRFGNYLNLSALESVYDVSLAATSLQQAFVLWTDYAIVHFPLLKFQVVEESNSFQLLIDSPIDDRQIKALMLDAYLTFIERELYLMIDKNVELKIEVPTNELGPYQKLYRFQVSEGPSHRVVFQGRLHEDFINQKNRKDLMEVLPAFIKAIHTVEPMENKFTNRVQKIMLQLAKPDFPKIEEVAEQLFMTQRTLQRKLMVEETNYREIAQGLKRKIYKYMTLGKSHQKKDIAHFLGYSGTSALLHAAAQWQN